MDARGSVVDFESPGDGSHSGSLTNTRGPAEFSQSDGNAGISGGGIDGESGYLFLLLNAQIFVLMLPKQIPCTMVMKYFLSS